MTQAWAETEHRTVHASVIQPLLERVGPFAEDATRRIQSEISSYGGPAQGRRTRLIATAIAQAAALFLHRLSGKRPSSNGVDDLFRRMGYGEGIEEHTLDALTAAVHLGGRHGWRYLQRVIIDADLSAATLAAAGEDLLSFTEHLVTQAKAGHQMAMRARDRDVDHNRGELITDLFTGRGAALLTHHAAAAGWSVPDRITVLIGHTDDAEHQWPEQDLFGGAVISVVRDGAATFFVPADLADEFTELASRDGAVIARCWPVDVVDSGHAVRWAERTMELVELGVLPRTPVVNADRFYSQLWLHGEPALRRHLAQELLRPLFEETPNSREILSETLLVWLETRESAPAIAAILGVHPQTVRYRWRRINELFGDTLRDPEYVGQLTMVLKSSLPLWLAGDKGDFERYWNVEAG